MRFQFAVFIFFLILVIDSKGDSPLREIKMVSPLVSLRIPLSPNDSRLDALLGQKHVLNFTIIRRLESKNRIISGGPTFSRVGYGDHEFETSCWIDYSQENPQAALKANQKNFGAEVADSMSLFRMISVENFKSVKDPYSGYFRIEFKQEHEGVAFSFLPPALKRYGSGEFAFSCLYRQFHDLSPSVKVASWQDEITTSEFGILFSQWLQYRAY